MTTHYTTAEAAAALGITPARVRQLAQAMANVDRLGRDWLFTAEQVELLGQRCTTRGRRPRPAAPATPPPVVMVPRK